MIEKVILAIAITISIYWVVQIRSQQKTVAMGIENSAMDMLGGQQLVDRRMFCAGTIEKVYG